MLTAYLHLGSLPCMNSQTGGGLDCMKAQTHVLNLSCPVLHDGHSQSCCDGFLGGCRRWICVGLKEEGEQKGREAASKQGAAAEVAAAEAGDSLQVMTHSPLSAKLMTGRNIGKERGDEDLVIVHLQ